jgi:hypothetical protein
VTPKSVEGKFLDKFREGEDAYSLEKLTLLGIMLSTGGPSEKAMYLSRQLDIECVGTV